MLAALVPLGGGAYHGWLWYEARREADRRAAEQAAAEQDALRRAGEEAGKTRYVLQTGHDTRLVGVTLSADARLIATAGDDGGLGLWDAATGTLLRRFDGLRTSIAGDVSGVVGLDFLPGADRLLVRYRGGFWRRDPFLLWDSAGGVAVKAFGTCASNVTATWPSRDARQLLIGCNDGEVGLWDGASGKPLQSFAAGSKDAARVTAVVLAPDGARALSYADRTTTVWDVASGKALCTIPEQRPLIACLTDARDRWRSSPCLEDPQASAANPVFTADGRHVFLGGIGDRKLNAWDVAGCRMAGSMTEPDGTREIIAVSPDQPRALAREGNRSLLLLDRDSGARIAAIEASQPDRNLRFGGFSPDGTALLTLGDGDISRTWALSDGSELGHFDGSQVARFSPDGKALLTMAWRGVTRFWQTAGAALQSRFAARGSAVISSLAFAPDGRQLLAGNGNGLLVRWDLTTGESSTPLNKDERAAFQASFVRYAPDGRHILVFAELSRMRVWELGSGLPPRTLEDKTSQQYRQARPDGDAAFSPDGSTILTAGPDSLALWNTEDGSVKRRFTNDAGGNSMAGASAVAISPDGRQALSGSEEGGVRLWPLAAGQPIWAAKGHEKAVSALAFAADGQRALSVSWQEGTLVLWEVATGKPIRRLGGGDGPYIVVAAFAPDGKSFVTGNGDGSLIVWDTASGAELRRMQGHQGAVASIAFAPDGRQIASGGWDHTIRLWDAASGATRLTLFHNEAGSLIRGQDERFMASTDPRKLFALVRGTTLLPLDDYIARNRRDSLAALLAP